jgi:hypothetical protein
MLELLARLAAVCGMPHPEALRFQEVPHQLRDLLVVLDDQNRHPRLLVAAHASSVTQNPAHPAPREDTFIDFSLPAPEAVIGPSDHRQRERAALVTHPVPRFPTGWTGRSVAARLGVRRLAFRLQLGGLGAADGGHLRACLFPVHAFARRDDLPGPR